MIKAVYDGEQLDIKIKQNNAKSFKSIKMMLFFNIIIMFFFNINGVLAYFTDTDTKTNVFTIKENYTVGFNANTGIGSMSNQSISYNVSEKLRTNAFSKTGYSFTGWNTVANGTGIGYADKQSVCNIGDITLFAQWSIDTYNISYYLNGGTVSTSNPATYNVETNSFTLNNPVRSGYVFKGWSGTDLTGDTNTTVTIVKGSLGNRSYTANWIPNTYNIVYNANGGTGSMSAQTMTYGVNANLTANAFSRVDYIFKEWNTFADGSGTVYEDEEEVVNLATNGTVNLYAIWQLNKSLKIGDVVNYNANRVNVNGDTFTTDYVYQTSSALTGRSAVNTFSSSDSMTWKVLSIDENTGVIELISANGTPDSLGISGNVGYENIMTLLSNASEVYGHGYGATGARSVKLADIEQYSSYDKTTWGNGKYGTTKSYTSGNYFFKEISKIVDTDGTINVIYDTNYSTATVSNPIMMTQTYYTYTTASYFSNTDAYNMLFKNGNSWRKSYWLANYVVELSNYSAVYGIASVNGGAISRWGTIYSSSYSNAGSTYTYGWVNPVVTLRSDIQLTWDSVNQRWDLM